MRVLEGNPARRPLPQNEPMPEPDVPRCPSHLPQAGKTEWRRVVKELAKIGLLSQIDRGMLAAYCAHYARWVQAEKHLQRDEVQLVVRTATGTYQRNPWVTVANDAMQGMKSFATEFGMSPAARTRIQVETEKEEKDPLQELIDKRKASGASG